MIGKSLLAAALLALGLAAPKAHAVVIYDWVGTCEKGCTGQATAVLTLADSYTPGSALDFDDFISFSYSSISGSYGTPAEELLGVDAELPAESGEVFFSSLFDVPGLGNGDFVTGDSGNWETSFPPTGLRNAGENSVWTLRPSSELSAPGPLSLLALGLVGLALAERRHGKARA